MATIFIDPTARSGGNGSLFRPFNTWSQVTFKPGDTYLQRAGTSTTATVNISAQGSAAAPIVLGAYGSGAAPVINGMVNLGGAAHVTLSGFTIRNSSLAAVTIQDGAHSNTIVGNTLERSKVGLWLGNGAGGDNVIVHNTVRDSTLLGIGVHEIANPEGRATRITGNTVTNSGAHGIDIAGNNFIIDGNTVSNSGLTTSGSSGIHVFGGVEGEPTGFGIGNIIANNITFDNRDPGGPDGNGIQLDQHTHGNVVVGNLATGNDGAGISLYDSHDNILAYNLADSNQRDPAGIYPLRGDIILAGSLDLTRANFLAGNAALSTDGPAVLVDALTADNANGFTGNIWRNTVGGADVMLGTDASWTSWLANDMTAGSGLPQDADAGMAAIHAPYAEQLTYSFATGVTQVIDGITYLVVSAPDSQQGGGGDTFS